MLLQICIAFAIHPLPHLVMIPKSVIAARITENLKSTELKLDQEDMRRLRELETKNHRSILVSKTNETSCIMSKEFYPKIPPG